MAEYTKEELFDLIINNSQEFSDYIASNPDTDLSEVDFSSTNLENVKDRDNLSSFKTFFTPTTGENGEAAKIKKNNGAAVLSGLQTLSYII